jgi:general secretion pathway protein C
MIRRIPPGLIWLVAALAVVSLGARAGPVVWRLTGEDVRMTAPPGAVPSAETPRPDLAPILAFAPFGAAVLPDDPPELAGETSLGLTLIGITIADPASRSRAIIAGGDVPERSYAVGETVIAGATVSAIEQDHVVLLVDGQLETLSFASLSATGSFDVHGVAPETTALVPVPAAPMPERPDELLTRYRAELQRDAQGVLDALGLQAGALGYVIAEEAPDLVRDAGFRVGDIVTRVNGQKVGDILVDQRYFDDVVLSGRARVEVLRDGETIILSFPLR